MNFRELYALRKVEFQTLIVRDIVILVIQIGNQFSTGRVLRSDIVVHLFQGGAKHGLLYDYVLGT